MTLHHAEFGVAELSLLKVRVLAAGVLFMVLTLLPVITAARTYGIFGLDGFHFVAIGHKPEDRRLQHGLAVHGRRAARGALTGVLKTPSASVDRRARIALTRSAAKAHRALLGKLDGTLPVLHAALPARWSTGLDP